MEISASHRPLINFLFFFLAAPLTKNLLTRSRPFRPRLSPPSNFQSHLS